MCVHPKIFVCSAYSLADGVHVSDRVTINKGSGI